jgi:hypothetical protein
VLPCPVSLGREKSRRNIRNNNPKPQPRFSKEGKRRLAVLPNHTSGIYLPIHLHIRIARTSSARSHYFVLLGTPVFTVVPPGFIVVTNPLLRILPRKYVLILCLVNLIQVILGCLVWPGFLQPSFWTRLFFLRLSSPVCVETEAGYACITLQVSAKKEKKLKSSESPRRS